jgi:hypothetical protein
VAFAGGESDRCAETFFLKSIVFFEKMTLESGKWSVLMIVMIGVDDW